MISRKLVQAAATLAVCAFSSPTALAQSNPLIRTCTINLGTYEVAPMGTDDIALCRWNHVVIDSATLVESLNGIITKAASIILSRVRADSCADVRASELHLSSGETLCHFADDSKLSLLALKAGLSDADRLHLKEVLSAR